MTDMEIKVRDPVCGMMVAPHRIELIYMQVRYAFCSKQCAERFVAGPHRYNGSSGDDARRQPTPSTARGNGNGD